MPDCPEIIRRNAPQRRGLLRHVRCLSILCISALPAVAGAEVLPLETFMDLAHRCGSTVAPSTLAAVAKTESGFETLAVLNNSTGQSHTYRTLDEAAASVDRFVTRGDSVDMGLMQINSANLKRLGMTVRDALDPCKSIAGGAEILTKNYLSSQNAPTEQSALRDAISQYNTGNRTAGYRNGYVSKVEKAATTLPVSAMAVPQEGASDLESWNVWESEDDAPRQDPPTPKPGTIQIF